MHDENRLSGLENRIERIEKLLEELIKSGSSSNSGEAGSVLASFDFSDKECRENSGWKIYNAEKIDNPDAISFKAIQVERTLGVFCDPMLVNNNINIPIDDIKRVHVRLKSNVDASQKCMLRVFFTTEKHPDWSQSKSVHNYYPAGRNFDVYVDTKNRYWNGMLTKLRVDPVEGLKGSIELELIELLDADGNVKYSTDFTKTGDYEKKGWEIRNTTVVHHTGKLIFNVDVLEKKRVYNDPFIVADNLCIDASQAKYIHIKMRADIVKDKDRDTYMQILFKTKNSNFWTQDKSMRFSYNPCEDIDAYIEVKQLFWKGTIVALRIDPFENFEGRADIRLIELLSEIPLKDDIDILEARTRHLEDRFIKIYS